MTNFGAESMMLINMKSVIILKSGALKQGILQKELMTILAISTLLGIGLEKIIILEAFQNHLIGGN